MEYAQGIQPKSLGDEEIGKVIKGITLMLRLFETDATRRARLSSPDSAHTNIELSEWPGKGVRGAWMTTMWADPKRAEVAHRVIFRLSRVLLRIALFGKAEEAATWLQQIPDMVSAGMELLAQSPTAESVDAKLLHTRYHCTKAMCYTYSLNPQTYNQKGIVRILYHIGLAKSCSIRAGGEEGISSGAIARIHEAEALLCEGRLLMGKRQWRDAKARQSSALHELSDARAQLTKSRLALVWWRELAILQCAAAMDSVKRSVIQAAIEEKTNKRRNIVGLVSADLSKEEFAYLSDAAEMLETLSKDLRFLNHIAWNDEWRHTRLWFGILRFGLYAWGLLEVMMRRVEGGCPLSLSVVVRLLRAIRLAGGLEAGVPSLPTYEENPQDLGKTYQEFRKALGTGRYAMIQSIHDTINHEHSPDRETHLQQNSGLYTGSFDILKVHGKQMYDVLAKHSDSLNDRDLGEWLRLCRLSPVVYGHGNI